MVAQVYRKAKYNSCNRWTCGFAVSVFLLFFSAIAFAACAFVIARPGIAALKFRQATCTSINSTFVEARPCECGGLTNDRPGCESYFPCIRILVSYQLNSSNSTSSNTTDDVVALLYEHESTMYSKHSDCSIVSCEPDKKANILKVNIFNQVFAKPGKNFTCFVDAFDSSIAVVDRNFKHIHIILSLAIPGSIFLICLIIVTTMCVIKCRRKEAPLPKQQVSRKYLDPSMLTNTNQPVQVKDRPLPGSYSDLVDARQKQLPPPLTSNTTV